MSCNFLPLCVCVGGGGGGGGWGCVHGNVGVCACASIKFCSNRVNTIIKRNEMNLMLLCGLWKREGK